MSQSDSNRAPDLPDLKDTLDEAEWTWLKSHALRDGLVIIAPDVDLLEAARAIASDNKVQVQSWLEKGKVSKPSVDQIAAWDAQPTKRFLSVVVQPFVLIQELLLH